MLSEANRVISFFFQITGQFLVLSLVLSVEILLLIFLTYHILFYLLALLFSAFVIFVFTLLWIPLESPLFKKIVCLLGKIHLFPINEFIFFNINTGAWDVQRQFVQEEFVVIGYTLGKSRWTDDDLTYRIRQVQ